MEESRRRITRNAPVTAAVREESTYVDKFINITEGSDKLFLFWENAPILKIKNEEKSE